MCLVKEGCVQSRLVAMQGCGSYRSHPMHRGPAMTLIYKICPRSLWAEAETAGHFAGAPIDLADGFIHFSTAAQAAETAARHFAGISDLLLITVEAEALGHALVFEPSRGGDLFPHLYGKLSLDAVKAVDALPLGPDGRHVFPAGFAAESAAISS